MKPWIRGAKTSELAYIQKRLAEVIDTTADYTPEFRAMEKARLNLNYLSNLHAIDPDHIMLCMNHDEIVGGMITGPEFGTLWVYWSFLFPEARGTSAAMTYARALVAHWDNGRFHKMSTYALESNRVSIALMKRAGYEHIVTLEKHIFGQDFMLWEHKLNKIEPGYDHGMNVGLRARLKRRIAGWLGLAG
ncbi:MAG: hypothetical protein H6873_11185 [Hyphomicrobiaceae bacterium]|nr:hypothetical protein [Hyphomicrobiaceae bacterium]